MSEHHNVQLVNEALAAINVHNIDRYVELIDDSFVGVGELIGTIHGHDGVRRMWATLFQAFPDLRFDAEQTIASGDQVVARVVLTGTHQGHFAGAAPTNHKITWRQCVIVDMRNGKAVRTRTYADNVDLFRQIGVLPAAKTATSG
jgi:steroid delta-isomerase-like uncharacterized protein